MRLMGPTSTGEIFGGLQSAADGTEVTCVWSNAEFEELKARVRKRGYVTDTDRAEGLAIRDAENARGADSFGNQPVGEGPWTYYQRRPPAPGTRVLITTEKREGRIVQAHSPATPWFRLSDRDTDNLERAWHVLLDTGEIRLYLESVLDLEYTVSDEVFPVPTEQELEWVIDRYAMGVPEFEHWQTPALREILDRVAARGAATQDEYEAAMLIRDAAETAENIAESWDR
jgi:hypothetical protein